MTANHVVFGTGPIGRAIMDELVKGGETVRMVNHSGKMNEIPAGVEVVASDLYDPARVKGGDARGEGGISVRPAAL